MNEETITKKTFKEEVNEWWGEHKDKIVVGVKCLAAGLAIGFIKGVAEATKINSEAMGKLIDRIPYEPDEDDDPEFANSFPTEPIEIKIEVGSSEIQ